MRRTLINDRQDRLAESWIDLETDARIELSSEDPNCLIESALKTDESDRTGWRASRPGRQVIRIIFDRPRNVHRIRLEFREPNAARTQEFSLCWGKADHPCTEMIRQQWNFNPQGSIREVEDYRVDLIDAKSLELRIIPDISLDTGFASLAAWQVA